MPSVYIDATTVTNILTQGATAHATIPSETTDLIKFIEQPLLLLPDENRKALDVG